MSRVRRGLAASPRGGSHAPAGRDPPRGRALGCGLGGLAGMRPPGSMLVPSWDCSLCLSFPCSRLSGAGAGILLVAPRKQGCPVQSSCSGIGCIFRVRKGLRPLAITCGWRFPIVPAQQVVSQAPVRNDPPSEVPGAGGAPGRPRSPSSRRLLAREGELLWFHCTVSQPASWFTTSFSKTMKQPHKFQENV